MTRGAATPVDDLSFVYFESVVIVGREAGRCPHRTIDVKGGVADATDQVVVIVAYAVFVARRRSARLDPPDDPFVDEDAERVVDGLARDRPEGRSHIVGELISGGVPANRYRSENGEALRRDLQSMLTQHCVWFGAHGYDS